MTVNATRRAGVLAVAILSLALAGCGQTFKKSLGLGKQVPDEYQVVENAPLSLPPDFHLRPPAPGAPRPQELDVRRQAEEILLGPRQAASGQAELRSAGELAFLNMAGATEVDPGIRQIINRESGVLAAEDEGFVERLMFWQKPPAEGVSIDPVAESERLRQNAEAGRPVTYGPTPVIARKEQAPLEGLSPF